MHQSIPAAPNPPPPLWATVWHFPRGGAFANFALPRDRAFANSGPIPVLLTRTQLNQISVGII